MTEQRRLAAILVADVVGYSRLVGQDESGTLASLASLRRETIAPAIAQHAGRLFKSVGDGVLVEFASAVQAVLAAQRIQQANAGGPLALRIGLHVGDVVVQGSDLMGDGVNIAARLESVAEPGGIALSREVHAQVRDRLDLTFVDKGEVALKNLARPVHVFAVGGARPAAAIAAPLALPDKPSLAVLPFQNMSGDPEQEYFVDGLVEDLITTLSRARTLFVIARNSSFAYKGQAVDVTRVGRELGVRYVLEGSVRRAGDRVRITGQLIDASNGAHLWADRFDGRLEDIFELQDRVTLSIVGAVQPELRHAEIERSGRKPTASLGAYDWYLRGVAHLHSRTRPGIGEALDCFDRSIRLDPRFAAPYGLSAYCLMLRRTFGWSDDPLSEPEQVRRLVAAAATCGRDDPAALWSAGHALAFVVRDIEGGLALIARALALDPGNAIAWGSSAFCHTWLGDFDRAIEHAERGLRLNPRDPLNFQGLQALALALSLSGRHVEAIAAVDRSLRDYPETLPTLRIAAIAHALAGQPDEARRLGARVLVLEPTYTRAKHRAIVPLQRPQDLERTLGALALAGIPE